MDRRRPCLLRRGDDFASFEVLFERLGVEAAASGPARFDDDAEWAWVRERILAPVLR